MDLWWIALIWIHMIPTKLWRSCDQCFLFNDAEEAPIPRFMLPNRLAIFTGNVYIPRYPSFTTEHLIFVIVHCYAFANRFWNEPFQPSPIVFQGKRDSKYSSNPLVFQKKGVCTKNFEHRELFFGRQRTRKLPSLFKQLHVEEVWLYV